LNFGFLIDNRTCIGCHACSTACKQENQVPLGVHRTWVKYVEKGAFPHSRRFFQVTRCNHCANPPCVRICPVSAMFQRDDGIVDFDPRVCIGCKACLQACPYDAIYVDPNSGTAAKCHFCAHRTEIGLEPACVVVCPEQAIVAGDLDDPGSRISQLVARHPTSVRKPEQGTAPKLFYIDADEVTLTPTAASAAGSFAFAEVETDQARAIHVRVERSDGAGSVHRHEPSDAMVRAPRAQGLGSEGGPLHLGQTRLAEQMVQTAFNAQHRVPWHWPVPAYLVTKAVAAGMILALTALAMRAGEASAALMFWPFAVEVTTVASLAFTAITTLLLVLDLERPQRFLLILTRPQWSSWLTRGAFLLIAFAMVNAIWLALHISGLVRPGDLLSWGLLGLDLALAVAVAAYTGLLFGQAEGRDLWQSSLLPVHLVVQALMSGASVWLLLAPVLVLLTGTDPLKGVAGLALWTPAGDRAMASILMGALLIDLLFLYAELGLPHASGTASRAAHTIVHGRYRALFWGGTIAIGHVLPVALLALDRQGTAALAAAACALVGLYAYEHAFVMAPQEIPNS
jgi:Fe-S-cluster-containing dehydrogenase component/formate-dependent nitrite reductase membrane component NrfD